ncbi:MAG TPA: hypothetical protein VGN35_05550 [Jatrophihabitantaceae bacterium]|jgi:RNA polymerase-binding transcription factor DksA|nr:hypothetical protein [Jatrophihabitantaceae bacterium]
MSAALIASQTGSLPLDRAAAERVRLTLVEQRRFRLDQLAELERDGALRCDDPTAREVARSLVTGARGALLNICEALRQIDAGRYGWCRDCRSRLSLEQLEILPHITRCPACLRMMSRT